jgi:hypothetical protein
MRLASWFALFACVACACLLSTAARADSQLDAHAAAEAEANADAHAALSAGAGPAAPVARAGRPRQTPAKASGATAPAAPASINTAKAKHHAVSAFTSMRRRIAVQDDAPFSFRGIPLGITLAALRETHTVRATPHESSLICETDVAGGDLGMTLKSHASLTVACRWAHRTASGWAPSRAVVAGAPAADHILRFSRESADEPLRLYEMSFVVDDTTAIDLRNVVTSHYGAPRVQGDPSLPRLEWDNAASTITLCLLPASGNATLTYWLKPAPARTRNAGGPLKISQFDEG